MKRRNLVSFDELYKAYLDCRKHKRSSHNCAAFEINEMEELYDLYEELNTMSYKIGRSNTFIFHEPGTTHFREIFAANFKDRIVQHLLINRMHLIFENEFIDHSFSCREGKGTSYGVQCLYEDIKSYTENYTKPCIVVNLDIKSFFASLDKNIMFEQLCNLLYDHRDDLVIYDKFDITEYDLVFTKWLIRLIVFNDPRKGCIFKQPKHFWKNVAKDKSAFHIPFEKYLPVGNITSQYFANLYLSNLDKRMSIRGPYGRYVDDTYHLCRDMEEAQMVIRMMKEECDKLGLKIHPNKIYIQDYQKGIKFVGRIVKKDRIYVLNKTIGKFWGCIKNFYNTWKKNGYITARDLAHMVNCINSRLGLLLHSRSYNIRRKILCSEYMTMFGKYAYVDKDMKKLIIYEEYRIGERFRNRHLSYFDDADKRTKLKTNRKVLK